MKQLGLAEMQYVQDYGETFPVCTWSKFAMMSAPWTMTHPYGPFYMLEPYLKNVPVLGCPSAGGPKITQYSGLVTKVSYVFNGQDKYTLWGVNWNFSGSDRWDSYPARLGSVKSPASVVSMADCGIDSYAGPLSGFHASGYSLPRHSEGNNLTFADGHAKWYSMKGCPDWNATWSTWHISFDRTYEP
jgi:prepilin-type processing-associated H-X9-DG protein